MIVPTWSESTISSFSVNSKISRSVGKPVFCAVFKVSWMQATGE